jgi:segregation and condensation protein B
MTDLPSEPPTETPTARSGEPPVEHEMALPGDEVAVEPLGSPLEGFPSGTSSEGDIRSDAEPALSASLEAILLVVDEPAAEVMLAQVLDTPVVQVHEALALLAADYAEQGRGFELREVAGGWRFYTRSECAGVVERFVLDGQQARLTQAALETLAVVAYRQPVSRARVSAVRGVNVDGVMRTLVTRGLVEESGTESESGSILYRTTSYFLERLGLTSLEDLPPLAPYLPEIESLDSESFLASS